MDVLHLLRNFIDKYAIKNFLALHSDWIWVTMDYFEISMKDDGYPTKQFGRHYYDIFANDTVIDHVYDTMDTSERRALVKRLAKLDEGNTVFSRFQEKKLGDVRLVGRRITKKPLKGTEAFSLDIAKLISDMTG